ncbi:MAG: hypothetical protein E7252_00385 [Lachnospira sp.]|nr:hypothetical protein [Lachnospira sp.]
MKKKIILLILISLSISGLIFAYSKGMLPGMYDKYSDKRPYDYLGSVWKCEELQIEFEVPKDFIEDKDAKLYGTMIKNNEEVTIFIVFQRFGSKRVLIYTEENGENERILEGICEFDDEQFIIQSEKEIVFNRIK